MGLFTECYSVDKKNAVIIQAKAAEYFCNLERSEKEMVRVSLSSIIDLYNDNNSTNLKMALFNDNA